MSNQNRRQRENSSNNNKNDNDTNINNSSSTSDEELPTAVFPFQRREIVPSHDINNNSRRNRNPLLQNRVSNRNAGFDAIAQVERQIEQMNQLLGVDAAPENNATATTARTTTTTSRNNNNVVNPEALATSSSSSSSDTSGLVDEEYNKKVQTENTSASADSAGVASAALRQPPRPQRTAAQGNNNYYSSNFFVDPNAATLTSTSSATTTNSNGSNNNNNNNFNFFNAFTSALAAANVQPNSNNFTTRSETSHQDAAENRSQLNALLMESLMLHQNNNNNNQGALTGGGGGGGGEDYYHQDQQLQGRTTSWGADATYFPPPRTIPWDYAHLWSCLLDPPNNWVAYTPENQLMIDSAFQEEGTRQANISMLGDQTFQIHFDEMVQVNPATGSKRTVVKLNTQDASMIPFVTDTKQLLDLSRQLGGFCCPLSEAVDTRLCKLLNKAKYMQREDCERLPTVNAGEALRSGAIEDGWFCGVCLQYLALKKMKKRARQMLRNGTRLGMSRNSSNAGMAMSKDDLLSVSVEHSEKQNIESHVSPKSSQSQQQHQTQGFLSVPAGNFNHNGSSGVEKKESSRSLSNLDDDAAAEIDEENDDDTVLTMLPDCLHFLHQDCAVEYFANLSWNCPICDRGVSAPPK